MSIDTLRTSQRGTESNKLQLRQGVRLSGRTLVAVACDLDGTLLHSDGALSPRTVAALRELGDRNIPLILASARPPEAIVELATELDLIWPVICQNGASVSLPQGGGLLLVRAMAIASVHKLLKHALRAFRYVALDTPTQRFVLAGGADPPLSRRPHEKLIEDWTLLRDPITCVVVYPANQLNWENHEVLVYARSLGLTVASSSVGLVEFSSPGASKGQALEWLCTWLHIPLRGTVAFGDMPNDEDMLLRSGLRVAVANADPRVLKIAHVVAADNDDDGVARTIEELLGLRSLSADPESAPTLWETHRSIIPSESRRDDGGRPLRNPGGFTSF